MDRDPEEYGLHCKECRTLYMPNRSPRIRGGRGTARIDDYFCSGACRVYAHRRRKREQRDAERQAVGNRPCGNWDCAELVYWWERPDKRYCTNACRQKFYRECGGPPIPADVLAAVGELAARVG